jgi:3',5'-cyclic AMP phosphodiesterase CpdA
MLICQISDLHILPAGGLLANVVDTAAMFRACVADVGTLPQRPDVVLLTGDLVEGGRPEEYALLRELLAPLGMPVHVIPGNHDDRDALRAAFADHGYLPADGPFLQYALEDYPVRIVALDTVIPREGAGRLCAERLAWLDRTLAAAPSRPTALMMHHPPFRTFIGHMDAMGLIEGAAAFRDIVARHPQVDRILCGHLHRPIQARVAHVPVATCPSPAHQIVLDVAENAREAFVMEPPAYLLHKWTPQTGIVTHTAYVGAFPGPYPFD